LTRDLTVCHVDAVKDKTGQAKNEEEDLDAYMDQLSKAPTEKATSIYNLQKELKQLEKVKINSEDGKTVYY
jgi:hypothetical protein